MRPRLGPSARGTTTDAEGAPISLDKRSLTIAGHRTSVALEAEFWHGLEAVAAARGTTLPRLVAEIDRGRGNVNLASALRLRVLAHYRNGGGAEAAAAAPDRDAGAA